MKEGKRPVWRLILAVIIVGVGVTLVLNAIQRIIDTSDTINIGIAPVITSSSNTPEEKLPSEVGYKWVGQRNDPYRLVIPRISIDALIQNVGVDQNQQIAVPNNIHIAGWFVDSVRPGEKGLSIIDGHINGPTVDGGVFKRLPELTKGDEVTVSFGDRSSKTFEVVTTRELQLSEVPDVLFSQEPSITNQLNLITCIGTYDKASQTYDKRFIVTLSLKD